MEQIDFLTGCLSKESIDATLDKVKAGCTVDKLPFSILVVDLDRFKIYNDKYGHLDGDDILKYFASTLRITLKEVENFIFRFGGDEFIIVFPGKNCKEAFSIINSVIKILKKRPFLSRGRIYRLSFSGGIASYPADGRDIEDIIQKADKAMYFSKTHGRGRATIYGQITWKTIEKTFIVLVSILLAGGLLFYFQQSSYKDYVIEKFRKEVGKVSTSLAPQTSPTQVKIDTEEYDLVYLKSGRILRGAIVRNDEDEIEINLVLDMGKGIVTIKRSDIDRIRPKSKNILPKTNHK